MKVKKIFEDRQKEYHQLFLGLNKRYNFIATVRIITFIAAVILLVILANYRMAFGIGVLVLTFPIIFGLIVKYHNRLTAKRDQADFTAIINQQEVQRLESNFQDLDQGDDFKDKKHPYLHDLDIFGRNSLFQLTSRCVTPSGRNTLAAWFSAPAPEEQIIERQEALREIMPMLDWRQKFQASGMQRNAQTSISTLLEWVNEPNRLVGKTGYKIAAYILPIFTIVLILLNIYAGLSIYFTIGLLALNGIILKKFAEYVDNITEKTFKSIRTLQSYGKMIGSIEEATFNSNKLKNLQSVFIHDNFKASDSILKLEKILDYLQSRANMFYLFFNFILLFDLHLVLRAERWKRLQKGDVNHWFENIGELEALNSLAGLAYSNPQYATPEISKEPYVFETQNLGHPLIPAHERVANELKMRGKGTINIITGSNMSGKSTFLRTVGINIVLALAGGPVCADRMVVSRQQVFTSMRTEDNLEEHVSSFYAELRRIRQLLDMLQEEGLPILFMLDEILKGTNSKDRHAGAAALIRQVSDTDAMGFVSTHDLELGQLAEELPNLKNYSFNSIVEGDEIIFNYTLEEGVCHSFNASKLMEKIGIKMN